MYARDALKHLAEEKRGLESRIRKLISTEVASFTNETGVVITGVEVRTLAMQFVGAPTNYTVSGVTVVLALG